MGNASPFRDRRNVFYWIVSAQNFKHTKNCFASRASVGCSFPAMIPFLIVCGCSCGTRPAD